MRIALRHRGQEPEYLLADADDRDVEIPFIRACPGCRGLQSVDLRFLYRFRQQAGDPAARQVIGKARLFRIGDAVETDCDLARPCRQDSLNLVVDHEPFRHVETNAERSMQECLAADITFLRAIAVKQPVYTIEKPVSATISDLAFLAEGTGMPARKLDALWCIGVTRKEVEALVVFRIGRREPRIGRHGIKKARRCVRIVTRLAKHAYPDHIRLQLLLARKSCKPQLATGKRLLAGEIAGQDLCNHAARNHFRFFAALTFDPVVGGDVTHFVRQHGRHFRGVIGECQKPACHVKIPAGQSESVDGGRIENGDAVGLLRIFGDGRQRSGNPGDKPLRLGITIFAAIACHDAWMFACAHLRARIVLLNLFHRLRIVRGTQCGLVGRAEKRLAR